MSPKESDLYIYCGWRIHPVGGGRIHPMRVVHTSNGGGTYIPWGWCISTMDLYFQWAEVWTLQ